MIEIEWRAGFFGGDFLLILASKSALSCLIFFFVTRIILELYGSRGRGSVLP